MDMDRIRPLQNNNIVIASEAKQSHKTLIIQEIASSLLKTASFGKGL
jgi:hypothetical protein